MTHNANPCITNPERLLLPPTEVAKHHIIPVFRGQSSGYADFVAGRGIAVDDFTVVVSHGKASEHLKFIHGRGYNRMWTEWIDNNPNATAKDIYQFAGQMMDRFGLSGRPIVPYR